MTQKQVAVIGGGIVGVCTAYFLAEAGHEVAVIERHHNVGQETSYTSAAAIAVGHAKPWAAPGMPRNILSGLLRSAKPVLLQKSMERALWHWARRWLAECDAERYRINHMRMQRVAAYSRRMLMQLRENHPCDFEQSRGVLHLFRSQRDMKMAESAIALLADNGIAHRVIDAESARAIEPALGYRIDFAGALYLPDDESGNGLLFAKQMRQIAQALGVQFHFTSKVHAIEASAGRVSLQIDEHSFDADAVVLAAGAGSARLLRPLGIHVPLYPVKTYSATVAVRDFDEAPRAAIIDEAYRTRITRMGQRVRIAGIAELGSRSADLHEAALRTLVKLGSDWFPNAANYNTATFQSSAQPTLPDGPPLIGATPVRNVYLNIGHGAHGWAMAAGAAKAVADIVSGKAPEIDLDGLTLARYG